MFVIYPMLLLMFLIPVCVGFNRPLNMRDVETIFALDFLSFFYICSEYTSLSKWVSILLSLFFTIYTIALALQVTLKWEKFRSVFSTLIGRGKSRLGSHWSRAS